MELSGKVRRYENIHIVLWLIKDSCWMMDWRWLGVFMILPTLSLAIYLMYQTIRTTDFYLNASILFWILANSFWMLMEFFTHDQYSHWAALPFGFGFLFIGIFYWKTYKLRKQGLSH